MRYHRSYRDEQDYHALQQFLIAIYVPGAPSYCSVGDLDWWRGLDDDPNAIAQTQLWFEDERLLGFAWPSAGQVEIVIHPQHPELTAEVVAWATAAAVAPRLWAFSSDAVRIPVLQAAGYQRSDTFISFLTRPLDQLPERPALPDSFTIHPVQSAADIATRAAAQRAAFGTTRMTTEKYQAVTQLPSYRADLDLIVVTEAGECVTLATIWLDAANRFGLFEPVGTHPDFQRRGLARALLTEGLYRLRALGADHANVCSLGDDSAGARLYQSLGFQIVDRTYTWLKVR